MMMHLSKDMAAAATAASVSSAAQASSCVSYTAAGWTTASNTHANRIVRVECVKH